MGGNRWKFYSRNPSLKPIRESFHLRNPKSLRLLNQWGLRLCDPTHLPPPRTTWIAVSSENAGAISYRWPVTFLWWLWYGLSVTMESNIIDSHMVLMDSRWLWTLIFWLSYHWLGDYGLWDCGLSYRIGIISICSLVSPYYSYPNQRPRVYLYFVTFVSRQIQLVVVIIQQCYLQGMHVYNMLACCSSLFFSRWFQGVLLLNSQVSARFEPLSGHVMWHHSHNPLPLYRVEWC